MVFVITIAALAAACAVLALAARLAPERAAAAGQWIERRLGGLSLHAARAGQFDMPYLAGGRGEVLVLLHGFGGDKDNFTRAARFLTPHFRVIIPDLPGFGDASRDLSAGYTIDEQVARLHAFLGQLGIEGCHLGGNSMGGFIAAQYAASWPLAVKSLWLIAPSGTAASHSSAMLRQYQAGGRNALLIESAAAFDGLLAATTHKRFFLPRFVRTTLGRRAARDFALHTRIMREVAASPLLETSYGVLETPALIVWGEHDAILSPTGAQAFAALFPNSQVIIMPGIGHLPMAEDPFQSAVDCMAFMRNRGLILRE